MSNISILVVLYGKEIEDSKTLYSLAKNSVKTDMDITIFNNGPSKISRESCLLKELSRKFQNIHISETIENKPLSTIYNYFLDSKPDSDFYTILDDDSIVTDGFIEAIDNGDYDILAPKIISADNDKLYYPTISGEPISLCGEVDISNFMSIGSGLTLSKKTVILFKKYFNKVFDENFALYGIDTSFFLRARRMNAKFNEDIKTVCLGELRHSLSRVKGPISNWRRKERLYDLALTARYYPEYVSRINLVKDIIKYTFRMDLEAAKTLVVYFYLGKHPRS